MLSRHETEVQELRQIVNEKDEESKKRQSMLEQKLKEMEQLKLNVTTGKHIYCYYMTSDNVFFNWLMSFVTFFFIKCYIPHVLHNVR